MDNGPEGLLCKALLGVIIGNTGMVQALYIEAPNLQAALSMARHVVPVD